MCLLIIKNKPKVAPPLLISVSSNRKFSYAWQSSSTPKKILAFLRRFIGEFNIYWIIYWANIKRVSKHERQKKFLGFCCDVSGFAIKRLLTGITLSRILFTTLKIHLAKGVRRAFCGLQFIAAHKKKEFFTAFGIELNAHNLSSPCNDRASNHTDDDATLMRNNLQTREKRTFWLYKNYSASSNSHSCNLSWEEGVAS